MTEHLRAALGVIDSIRADVAVLLALTADQSDLSGPASSHAAFDPLVGRAQ